ncbi:methionine aminopeptidase 1B [Prunus dulcis]|uniref:Methionine aminopeptidase 1B n=1 Tax=Prunus dulcis TaxID=3755 RepID=A0A4Y1RE19_PRUDU|nr:methionine aminopeptidase 1B [Prunus dulcis]
MRAILSKRSFNLALRNLTAALSNIWKQQQKHDWIIGQPADGSPAAQFEHRLDVSNNIYKYFVTMKQE